MTGNTDIIRATYEGTSAENGAHLKAALAPNATWTEAAGWPVAHGRSDHGPSDRVPGPSLRPYCFCLSRDIAWTGL